MNNTKLEDGPWVLLDAAGPRVQTGVYQNGKWMAFEKGQGEAIVDIFKRVESVLGVADQSLESIRGWLFGMGPGSTLGIRLAAMAIQTWQVRASAPKPIFGFRGLEVLAVERARLRQLPELTLYAPWKRDFYHCVRLNESLHEITTTGHDEVHSANKNSYFVPVGRIPRNHTAQLPELDYDLSSWNPAKSPSLLFPLMNPEMYYVEEPEFQPWNPQRHRAQ